MNFVYIQSRTDNKGIAQRVFVIVGHRGSKIEWSEVSRELGGFKFHVINIFCVTFHLLIQSKRKENEWIRIGPKNQGMALSAFEIVGHRGLKESCQMYLECQMVSEWIRKYSPPFPPKKYLFNHIPAYSSIFQTIIVYSRLVQHMPALSSLFQPIQAYSSLFQSIPAQSILFQLI